MPGKADRNELVDLAAITIDPSLPAAERRRRYLARVGDPYRFRCGETAVRIRFSETGKTLDEAVRDHFLELGREPYGPAE